ncbi:DUF2007 domain-containing protein [bacterium]|nr:DUF2007 domain-containing protein [bacterium]MBU1073383.1 DUF2007 domain-containing protein [bacterium]MBU1675220.1 DUF2007 domain-containing protein [bacterium]
MYCPRCGAEYVDGVTECADCGVALQVDPAPPPDLSGELNLVSVLETGDAIRTALVKSLLEEAQIPYLARNDQLQDLFGFGRLVPVNPISGPVIFLVPDEYADEARDMLAQLDDPDD